MLHTHLKESANFAGRNASSGSVRKATKKQTAAPIKHPPNPSSLRSASMNPLTLSTSKTWRTFPTEIARSTPHPRSTAHYFAKECIPLRWRCRILKMDCCQMMIALAVSRRYCPAPI